MFIFLQLIALTCSSLFFELNTFQTTWPFFYRVLQVDFAEISMQK